MPPDSPDHCAEGPEDHVAPAKKNRQWLVPCLEYLKGMAMQVYEPGKIQNYHAMSIPQAWRLSTENKRLARNGRIKSMSEEVIR